jgi:hypothetical protein
MVRSTFFVLLALVAQQAAGRITPTRVDEEFGRHAKVDAFMLFEAAEEERLFFDRALEGHIMSASMSMAPSASMSMTLTAAPVSVDAATGTSSTGTSSTTVVVSDTPNDSVASDPVLEPVDTVTSTDSSAAKAAIGFSCIVGAMGALLF